MNISPRELSVKEWCDRNIPLLATYGQAPFLQDPADWQQWATAVCRLPGVAAFNPPNPLFFDDFYEWAERFNSAVPL